MKQTVFRKVYVKDRLPDSFGSYITNIGDCFYHNGSKLFESVRGFARPEWFLEEIELPSEEEVVKACECNDKSESNNFIVGVECGIIYSYNYILNKLK